MLVLKSDGKNSRKIVYIGLGSNRGERRKNIEKSLEFLDKTERIDVISVSPFYDTEPYGYKEQPRFLNGVAKMLTSLKPASLFKKMKKIEKEMGRRKGRRWGPRIIDLDILFYNNIVFNDEELIIPHPELHNRWFVLKPMVDIDPNFEHPVLKKTVNQLLEELNGKI